MAANATREFESRLPGAAVTRPVPTFAAAYDLVGIRSLTRTFGLTLTTVPDSRLRISPPVPSHSQDNEESNLTMRICSWQSAGDPLDARSRRRPVPRFVVKRWGGRQKRIAEFNRKVMQIINRQTIRNINMITLEIESLDAANAQHVSQRVSEAMLCGGQIVVDLGALRYFDVTGFAALLKWVAECPPGSEVRLCSGIGSIQSLFELLRAHSVVPLYQSREAALASFRREDSIEHGVADTPAAPDLRHNLRGAWREVS